MSKPDTWMPLYVGDYMADTMHLNTEQHGAYLLLLLTAWNRGGYLPGDEAQLALICRADKKSWARIRGAVMPFFDVVDHQIVQRRLLVEYEKATHNQAKQQANGRKGGRPIKTQNKPMGFDSDSPPGKPNETPSPSPNTKSTSTPAQDKPARFDPLSIQLPECVSASKWGEWLGYRRSRRLPTAEVTARKQLEFLTQCHARGQPPDAVIDASIANGWQGLFELKGNGNGKNGSSRADRISATIAELTGANRHPSAVIDGTSERVD